MLTLILSRQGRISSAPCHQSSEPSASCRVTCLQYIPSIMYVYLGESCQQCWDIFYPKNSAISELSKSSHIRVLYRDFIISFHCLPFQNSYHLGQCTPISYDLRHCWLSCIIFLNVNMHQLSGKATFFTPRIAQFCYFTLTASVWTGIY